ncbi:galactosylceramide sulfotransferase-like isoform X2 [Acanthaster planci]|uniref:Galactosylceramide sulfotransferase-like isoform X2 n=1 Tax=Acanthaster planci TaxID=133434 RepID=A0A8B8A3H2_ACAPL|nr:galactosylceramide sulfotransferase-like isoform X2 [Acanthaster planci]XP_022112245.1 galactosylceramide sulfotransferase-like isoform X2 [Acanthaster planci]XP_022112246.1 galactosylceramide sulfotransferase-like isoform X2 [Acanthaster planci]XP_022112247.1 galactosylceramide sulfotransferase-like isoform X2 [Acanthaster planci]
MAYSFRSSAFFVIFIMGLMSVTLLIAQSGHLFRKRDHIQKQEHGHRTRMLVHRSREALKHYHAWTRGQHHLPREEENAIPGKDDIPLLRHRAWSQRQHLLRRPQEPAVLREEEDTLQLARAWSVKRDYLPKIQKGSHFKEFGADAVITTNNQRWTNWSTRHCTPRRDIAFVKMHKCSSSTIQNILFRYGERHSLDFVLPPTHNILGRTYFDKRFMIQFPVDKYNILCHHTRFSAKGFAEVMSPNAVYTTILRDPVEMYESSFTYNDIAFRFNLSPEKGLEQFMQMPLYFYNRNIYTNSHVKNPMLYDLGLPESGQFSPSKINQKIMELTRQFDLVMITEYFDESVVLLRHLMCWEIDDMVYFILNARSKSSVPTLSLDLAEKIRDWNAGDVRLYDVFNKTFWKRVEVFGAERMHKEVQALQERVGFFRDYCIERVVDNDRHVWHPYGVKIDSFKLKPETQHDPLCNRMIKPELLYTRALRITQLRKYNMGDSIDLMTYNKTSKRPKG